METVCERCDGTGVLTSYLNGLEDELGGEEANGLGVGVTCPTCDGYGEIEN